MTAFVKNTVQSGNIIYASDHNELGDRVAAVLNGGVGDDNISSVSGTKIAGGTIPASALAASAISPWRSILGTITGVTHNGNRSYSLTTSVDNTALIAPATKLRITRTVAANTYMGGLFNGSSHYFTKVTPSGTLGTIANNFTLMAQIYPTSYPTAVAGITGRGDATPSSQLAMMLLTDLRVRVIVRNGALGNYRYFDTLQSVPINVVTAVAATWASGTVVIYYNGVSIPLAPVATGGTAPTTAGTGGDWSIGRIGAYNAEYYPGYISNVAVFSSVLSAATINQYATYKLTGSETDCIAAWSLDNTGVNQQSPGTNDMVASSGVSYTNISPFMTGATGVPDGTNKYDYAHVMTISASTIVCQVPSGCSIPTTGGVSDVSFGYGNPYGFPTNTSLWEIVTRIRMQLSKTSAISASTWYNLSGSQLYLPAGVWDLDTDVYLTVTHAGAAFLSSEFGLGTNTSSVIEDTRALTPQINTSSTNVGSQITRRKLGYTQSAAGILYGNIQTPTASVTGLYLQGTLHACHIRALPSGL